MLRVLDLFAGVGGFSLALENIGGFETAAFCEIDKHAQAVLKQHWPRVPVFEDVKLLNGKALKNIDVICGGFPCQDISTAGKQKGIKDGTRSGLWFEYKRLIQEIGPRWVIIENVRNLLSNGFATVVKDLSEIGYDCAWEVVSARSVGAPHFRERIWIVAYPNGQQIREQSRRIQWENGRDSILTGNIGQARKIAHSDDFRFWPTFATEEEKQQWWTEATAKFRDRWNVMPDVCRVDDGISKELDKIRAQRIKQLGNAVVPAIVEIIGKQILKHEGLK